MKQAIEEGFILDVLTNYTTYRSYYELTKSIEGNPEYETERAQKMLRRYVERDPKTIKAKAEVMLTHFDAKMYRNHKLKGYAKALVVTKDIECAISYYMALCEIKNEKKLPYNILIAFSGTKTVGGRDYSEAQINGFPDTKTAEEFDKDENRILVVANKYITGFDQPKLAAMYIDKPLDGDLAGPVPSQPFRTGTWEIERRPFHPGLLQHQGRHQGSIRPVLHGNHALRGHRCQYPPPAQDNPLVLRSV